MLLLTITVLLLYCLSLCCFLNKFYERFMKKLKKINFCVKKVCKAKCSQIERQHQSQEERFLPS
jgi:hypothetical protein